MITYHITSNKLFNYQISKWDAGYFKFFSAIYCVWISFI